MLKTDRLKSSRKPVDPLLQKVLLEAKTEHLEIQSAFSLLGWEKLPEELKLEIKDDVKAFKNELEGNYSSCDPSVQRRRKSVKYWIDTFRSGNCTLKTAVKALRVKQI